MTDKGVKKQVFVEGKEVDIHSPGDAIKQGLGFLTEERRKSGFVPVFSICHNLTLCMLDKLPGGALINKKSEDEIAQKIFDRLRVKAPSMRTQIINLSGGNQQKVIIGRWLLTDPEVLLLDEPTRGIDVGAKYEIYQLILDLANNGKTVVMVSSEMPELLGVCDRIVVMSGGRVAGEVDARNTTQEAIMTLAAKYV